MVTALSFPTMTALADYIIDAPRQPNASKNSEIPASQRDPEFCKAETCGETMSDAIGMATGGWQYGASLITRLQRDYVARVSDGIKSPVVAFDVTGDFLDVGAFVSGEPECFGFWDTANGNRKDKFITITVTSGFSWQVAESDIVKRGAAILSLVDILETNGVRCRVISEVIMQDKSDESRLQMSVVVKDFQDSLDLEKIAFSIVSPAFLRRFFFAIVERSKKHARMSHDGYGRCIESKTLIDADNIIVGTGDPASADWQRWILNTCRDIGLDVQG
jgi:hypothetical protein